MKFVDYFLMFTRLLRSPRKVCTWFKPWRAALAPTRTRLRPWRFVTIPRRAKELLLLQPSCMIALWTLVNKLDCERRRELYFYNMGLLKKVPDAPILVSCRSRELSMDALLALCLLHIRSQFTNLIFRRSTGLLPAFLDISTYIRDFNTYHKI